MRCMQGYRLGSVRMRRGVMMRRSHLNELEQASDSEGRRYHAGTPSRKVAPERTAIMTWKAAACFRIVSFRCANPLPFDLLRVEIAGQPVFQSAAEEDPSFDGYPVSLAMVDPAFLQGLGIAEVHAGDEVCFWCRNRTRKTQPLSLVLSGELLDG